MRNTGVEIMEFVSANNVPFIVVTVLAWLVGYIMGIAKQLKK